MCLCYLLCHTNTCMCCTMHGCFLVLRLQIDWYHSSYKSGMVIVILQVQGGYTLCFSCGKPFGTELTRLHVDFISKIDTVLERNCGHIKSIVYCNRHWLQSFCSSGSVFFFFFCIKWSSDFIWRCTALVHLAQI